MPRRKKFKTGGERFVKLPYFMLEHPSWRALSSNARSVFIELKRRYNGVNNGEISLSSREAADVANCSRNTAYKLFYELEYWGFIICRRQGTFKNRKASEFIITSEPYNNQPATNDWKPSRVTMPKDWNPQKNPRPNTGDARSQTSDRNDYMEEQIVANE